LASVQGRRRRRRRQEGGQTAAAAAAAATAAADSIIKLLPHLRELLSQSLTQDQE